MFIVNDDVDCFLLFQISVARSLSKDGFKEGLENAFGTQCSYNGWVDAHKWIKLHCIL